MKKYLFIALAALGFAACAEKAENNTPANNGEKEQSYIAVTLLADDMSSRADDGVYEEGDTDERIVKSLYFFLFDADGQPFDLGNGKNYKAVAVNPTGSDPTTPGADGYQNVSDVKNKVLVFNNYVGEYPAKIVAVINWEPTGGPYSLDALAEQMLELQGVEDGFVMSNAVYAAESTNASANKEAIRATALTPANIAKREDLAMANPVKIYVERIAAKVTVNTNEKNLYDIGEEVDGTKIYARILGWELYNDYDKSFLLKQINPAWTDDEVGFSWNDSAWFRSYWAISPDAAFGPENKLSYDQLTNSVGSSDYCGENTYNDRKDCTKVMVKAELVKQVDTDTYEAVEIANWYGNDYLGEAALRTVVANSLASQLYYLEGAKYKSIHFDDLMVVEANEPNPNTEASASLKSYHVFFQLSDAGKEKDWFTYSSTNGFVYTEDNNVNILLGGVEPALLYKGGKTYYHTDIKHLPSRVEDTQYGVVRNHVYKVNINSVTGFGTPVFNPNTAVDPITPDVIKTYVSAEIRILSWRVVEWGYEL